MKLKNKKLRHPKMVSYSDALDIPTHPCKFSTVHGMSKGGTPVIKKLRRQMNPKLLLLFLWFSSTLISPMPFFQGNWTCPFASQKRHRTSKMALAWETAMASSNSILIWSSPFTNGVAVICWTSSLSK